MRGVRCSLLRAKYLVQHETLTMQENADPFRLPMDHRVCHLDVFHMPLVAPVSEVLIDSEIVEVVCTFEALDSSSQGVEFGNTDSPGTFALQFF